MQRADIKLPMTSLMSAFSFSKRYCASEMAIPLLCRSCSSERDLCHLYFADSAWALGDHSEEKFSRDWRYCEQIRSLSLGHSVTWYREGGEGGGGGGLGADLC